MRKINIFFITIIISSSCSIFYATKSDKGLSCKKFDKFIKESWSYDDKDKIFMINDKDLQFFHQHKTCLYGKSKEEIKSILGKPNLDLKTSMRYFLDKKCNNKPQKYCSLLQVSIDDKNEVYEIRSVGYSRKY